MVIACNEDTADDSFAAIFALRKLGMAMAAMIRMIATTINNSIKLKPADFVLMGQLSLDRIFGVALEFHYSCCT